MADPAVGSSTAGSAVDSPDEPATERSALLEHHHHQHRHHRHRNAELDKGSDGLTSFPSSLYSSSEDGSYVSSSSGDEESVAATTPVEPPAAAAESSGPLSHAAVLRIVLVLLLGMNQRRA